jgi:hypothetical protein
MTAPVLLAVAVILATVVPPWLARSAWPRTAPRTAVVLWLGVLGAQLVAALGAAAAFAVAPAAAGVEHGLHQLTEDLLAGRAMPDIAPLRLIVLLAAVTGSVALALLFLSAALQSLRVRRRQRALRVVVGERARDLDIVVIPSSDPVSYCVPGRTPAIVVTQGAVRLLRADELAAVVAHERAHLRGRHHRLLLPFVAVHRALPRLPVAAHGLPAVQLLVELLADDVARRRVGRLPLARALVQLAAPTGSTLAATGSDVQLRVDRLLAIPRTLPALSRAALWLASSSMLLGPVVLLLAGSPHV